MRFMSMTTHNQNLTKAVICNLDGVLCDDSNRKHFVDARDYITKTHQGKDLFDHNAINWGWKPDYKSYFNAMSYDKVNFWCHDLIDRIDRVILFVTGRPEKYRNITEDWLRENSTFLPTVDHLFMRPNFIPRKVLCTCKESDGFICDNCDKFEIEDHRPSDIVKKEIYESEIKGKYEVLFCLEDNMECAKMYSKLGLEVLFCGDLEGK